MRRNYLHLFLLCVVLSLCIVLSSCSNSTQKDDNPIDNNQGVNSNINENNNNNQQSTNNGEVNNSTNNNQGSTGQENTNTSEDELPFFIRNKTSEVLVSLIRIKVNTDVYEDCINSGKMIMQDGTEKVRVYRIENIFQYDNISDHVTYNNNMYSSHSVYPYYFDDTEGFTKEMLDSLELSDYLLTKMAVTLNDGEIFTKYDEYIILAKVNKLSLDGGSFISSENNSSYDMIDYTTYPEDVISIGRYSSYCVIPIKDGKICFDGLSEDIIEKYVSEENDNLFQFNPYLKEEYRLNEGDTLEDIENWYIELSKLVSNSPTRHGYEAIKYDDGTIYHKVYIYDIIDGEKVLNKEKYIYAYIYEGWKLQVLNDDLYIIKGYNDTIYIEILDDNNKTTKLYLYSDIFSKL